MTQAELKLQTQQQQKGPRPNKQTFPGHFPSEMRRQMWPLCCGASILSGLKHVGTMNEDEIIAEINDVLTNMVPDFQIFNGETFKPHFTFLTLNSSQTASPKIMSAVAKCGFKKIGIGRPRGSDQTFFLRDTSGTWKPEV